MLLFFVFSSFLSYRKPNCKSLRFTEEPKPNLVYPSGENENISGRYYVRYIKAKVFLLSLSFGKGKPKENQNVRIMFSYEQEVDAEHQFSIKKSNPNENQQVK